jgi:ABC-type Fe3+ transport system substrate-binding protein
MGFPRGASIPLFAGGVTTPTAKWLRLLNRAPRPSSAKVFINWLLSREGQALFQKVISVAGDSRKSRRIDVPKDHIPADEQRRDKMTYFDTDDPDTNDLNPAMKLLDEILGVKK